MAEYRFLLNAVEVAVDADPKTSTLEVLRETLGVATCKAGCMPQGLCGCCTALIEGKPRLTCTLPIKSVAGKAVVTMDGLPEADRGLLAESFVRAGGTQCGYCTPGIVLSTWALLEGNPAPTRDEMSKALNTHICRCTGYSAIYAAMERAAAVRRGDADPLPPRDRPEGHDVTLGDRPYVDDLERPGMLYGGVVFAPVATGTVVGLDLDAARAIPGVVAVVARKAIGDRVTHVGDVVVGIAGSSPFVVRQAVAACKITADADLGATDLDTAPAVARGRRVEGRVDPALAAAAHRITETYRFAPTDPVYLEPEAALAVPVSNGFHVYSAGHDAAGEAAALTAAVGSPVRVFLVPSGGSYGGKQTLVVLETAVALARATEVPVRLALSMEDGMRVHPRRPGGTVEVTLGAGADGTLSAARLAVTLDGGVACIEPDRIVAMALGAFAWRCPNLDVSVSLVQTGNPSGGPVRGAGALAVAVAVDGALDRLATAVGEDGMALRRRNAEGDVALALAALQDAWDAAPGPKGVGVARVDGAGGAEVTLTVTGPDEVEIQCNVPELGQGRDEVLRGTLVALTGLPASSFVCAWADSAVVGAGAAGPVDGAARAAGEALMAGGGTLAERVGQRYTGTAAERAPAGVSASVAWLGPAGEVVEVHTVAVAGRDQDPRLVAELAEGAAHMGVGIALSEEVETKEGFGEGRLRYLGVLKSKVSPRLVGRAVGEGADARDISEAAVISPVGAVAGAVLAGDGVLRAAFPMKDSAAARGAGVRPPRPPPATPAAAAE